MEIKGKVCGKISYENSGDFTIYTIFCKTTGDTFSINYPVKDDAQLDFGDVVSIKIEKEGV